MKHIKFFIEKKINKICYGNAVKDIVSERKKYLEEVDIFHKKKVDKDSLLPTIDFSVVTYNNGKWLKKFSESILNLDYDLSKINIYFLDNSSQDDTGEIIKNISGLLIARGINVSFDVSENKGFGAGHNIAIRKGGSEFLVVCNVDIEFVEDSLINAIKIAVNDSQNVAAWEFRQLPYEHPKIYDPVSLYTQWNSHACVLLRRSSFEYIGGYDENIFMYGEDVEISYRFRKNGFILKYCPKSCIYHYSYEYENEIKPIQFLGSTFANMYIRIKYGSIKQKMKIFLMFFWLNIIKLPRGISKKENFYNSIKIFRYFHYFLYNFYNKKKVIFPFSNFDYTLQRDGAFVKNEGIRNGPLVSVITRTYHGRENYLKQSIISVMNQTYSNIQHIIVEDGGNSHEELILEIKKNNKINLEYFACKKIGRSAVGNIGLSYADGKYCLFLDDDDLLFADHVELLVYYLENNKNCVASYSLAFDVETELFDGFYNEMNYSIHSIMRQPFDNKILNKYNYLPIQSVLFKKDLFEKYGGFEEDMDALEDWVLWNKYAKNNEFIYVPKCTSLYRTPYEIEKKIKRQEIFENAYDKALQRITI